MHRTQILLEDGQLDRLREIASRRGTSLAQLIREMLDQSLVRGLPRDTREVRRRALAAAGRFRSGGRDVSRQHDRYLAEAFKS